ncbi:MAG: sulfotransferase, partial [Salibacteraceae bacterium]
NKSVFLEDNTYNILFASDILDLYPNSKLLHIVRSPLDVLASAQNQRWTPSNVKHLIVWYKQIMDKWFLEERKCDTGRIKVVRFEKLIENPTETIEEISLFFGLDSEKQMFELDLGSHNIGRYKTAFSKPEIELINRELDHYLHKLGYN